MTLPIYDLESAYQTNSLIGIKCKKCKDNMNISLLHSMWPLLHDSDVTTFFFVFEFVALKDFGIESRINVDKDDFGR